MTLDNEQQRRFLLELLKQAHIPGHLLDVAYALKHAIETAPASGSQTPKAPTTEELMNMSAGY